PYVGSLSKNGWIGAGLRWDFNNGWIIIPIETTGRALAKRRRPKGNERSESRTQFVCSQRVKLARKNDFGTISSIALSGTGITMLVGTRFIFDPRCVSCAPG